MFSFRNHFLKQKIYFLKRAFAKLVYYPANISHTISPQTFNLPHYSSPLAIHSRDTLSDSPKIAPKSHRTHVHVIHTHTHTSELVPLANVRRTFQKSSRAWRQTSQQLSHSAWRRSRTRRLSRLYIYAYYIYIYASIIISIERRNF